MDTPANKAHGYYDYRMGRVLIIETPRQYLYQEVPELRLLHTVLSFVEYCWPDINSDFKQHES